MTLFGSWYRLHRLVTATMVDNPETRRHLPSNDGRLFKTGLVPERISAKVSADANLD